MNSGLTPHQHIVNTETGPRFIVSSERPEERRIEPATFGLYVFLLNVLPSENKDYYYYYYYYYCSILAHKPLHHYRSSLINDLKYALVPELEKSFDKKIFFLSFCIYKTKKVVVVGDDYHNMPYLQSLLT